MCFLLKSDRFSFRYVPGHILNCFIAFSGFCFRRVFLLLSPPLPWKAKIYGVLTWGWAQQFACTILFKPYKPLGPVWMLIPFCPWRTNVKNKARNWSFGLFVVKAVILTTQPFKRGNSQVMVTWSITTKAAIIITLLSLWQFIGHKSHPQEIILTDDQIHLSMLKTRPFFPFLPICDRLKSQTQRKQKQSSISQRF